MVQNISKAGGGLDSAPSAQKDPRGCQQKDKGSDPRILGSCPCFPYSRGVMGAGLAGTPDQEF